MEHFLEPSNMRLVNVMNCAKTSLIGDNPDILDWCFNACEDLNWARVCAYGKKGIERTLNKICEEIRPRVHTIIKGGAEKVFEKYINKLTQPIIFE